MSLSSLEKLVVPKVEATKAAEAEAAEQKRLAEERFRSLLPKTKKDRAAIIYPSIMDGRHEFDANQNVLKFWVSGIEFQIKDEYIPADDGTPTEGYMGHDAYWTPYLYVAPDNEFAHALGGVGDICDVDLANANDPTYKDRARTQQFIADRVKEIGDKIACMVEGFLLKKDDYQYRESLRASHHRRW